MISHNIQQIENQLIGTKTKLIAVSKTKPNELILEAYQNGFKRFGENYVQELVDKHQQLPKDIEWHFIGHLQSNKVKFIAPFVHLIHGVDSLKLLQEIDKQAKKNDRIIDCLLQIYIAQEDSKMGMTETETEDLLASPLLKTLDNIRIIGLMGMASFTDNEQQIKREFLGLKAFFDKLNTNGHQLHEISMGMSGDYKMAIEAGSTLIRVGSAVFGGRS